jgi:hypothetical protein
MKKSFRARNILLAPFVLILVFAAGYIIRSVYLENNVCGPGDRIIRSEADAIERAKSRIFKARYGSHGKPGYVDEKPGSVAFGQGDDCCNVTRWRNIYGVIVWEVSLQGETMGEVKKRNVSAHMELSNCGLVFRDSSFISADPPR